MFGGPRVAKALSRGLSPALPCRSVSILTAFSVNFLRQMEKIQSHHPAINCRQLPMRGSHFMTNELFRAAVPTVGLDVE